MKREPAPRWYLHMGCGEDLIARIPLAASRIATRPGETVAPKPAKRKTGGGTR